MVSRFVLGAALLALIVSASASAQQPPSRMQEMMKMHEQMMSEMQANDARLDALVREMNAAAGAPRIDAVVAVVNELARQQRAMHQHMSHMHMRMMGPGGGPGARGMMRGQ